MLHLPVFVNAPCLPVFVNAPCLPVFVNCLFLLIVNQMYHIPVHYEPIIAAADARTCTKGCGIDKILGVRILWQTGGVNSMGVGVATDGWLDWDVLVPVFNTVHTFSDEMQAAMTLTLYC